MGAAVGSLDAKANPLAAKGGLAKDRD